MPVFRVYYKITEPDGIGFCERKYLLGETFADSQAKAISNIRYRLRKQYGSKERNLSYVAIPFYEERRNA